MDRYSKYTSTWILWVKATTTIPHPGFHPPKAPPETISNFAPEKKSQAPQRKGSNFPTMQFSGDFR